MRPIPTAMVADTAVGVLLGVAIGLSVAGAAARWAWQRWWA